jgi:hypothetical protein
MNRKPTGPVIKSEDSSNIKSDTYILKAADPFFDCDDGIKINHILKFHPSDKESLDYLGHEWLLRKDAPRKQEESEKQTKRKSKYADTNTGIEPDQASLRFEIACHAFITSSLLRRAGSTRFC